MKGEKVKAIVFMLPTKSRPLYEYIKSVCDVRQGIHNVCIDSLKLASAENDNGYSFQTALKLNIKTGGRNRVLHSYCMETIDLKSTMIVGIDIMTAPKKGKTTPNNDVLLMVSSISQTSPNGPPRSEKSQPTNPSTKPSRTSSKPASRSGSRSSNQTPTSKTSSSTTTPSHPTPPPPPQSAKPQASNIHTLSRETHNRITFTLIAVHKDHHTKLQLPPPSFSNFSTDNNNKSHEPPPPPSFLIHAPKPQKPTPTASTTPSQPATPSSTTTSSPMMVGRAGQNWRI
ncbi:MAG: hypothetical protein Q9182_006287 [Xanthomendoza sp. 2 TL-2023]